MKAAGAAFCFGAGTFFLAEVFVGTGFFVAIIRSVKLVYFHAKILPGTKPSANGGQNYTRQQQHAAQCDERTCKLVGVEGCNTQFVDKKAEGQGQQHHRYDPAPERKTDKSADKRLYDEKLRGAYQLHAFYQKAAGEDAQAQGAAD